VTRPVKNWLEWTVFGLGLILIAGIAAYLVHAAATRSERPPALAIQVGSIIAAPAGFAVPLTVTNSGDVTAEQVIVEVLNGDARTGERSELTLAFVPHGSTRHGWVIFERRPDPGGVRARVLGYEEP
jgi:uncharacterized protein (TIGR02588 family)